MLQVKLLIEANVSIDVESFRLKDDNKEVVEGELHVALSNRSAADSSLQKVIAATCRHRKNLNYDIKTGSRSMSSTALLAREASS